MDIHIKLLLTVILTGFFLHLLAYPTTKFAELGERIFKDYGRFLNTILFTTLFFVLIIFFHWIWTL